MNDRENEQVELAVRRILAKEELEVRRAIAEEIQAYRQFVQGVSKWALSFLGLFLVAAGAYFAYFFGETAKGMIDDKIVQYRVNETMRQQLAAQVRLATEDTKVTDHIRQAISAEVLAQVNTIVADKVAEEIMAITSADAASLLSRAVDAKAQNIERRLEALEYFANSSRISHLRQRCVETGGAWDEAALDCI